MTPGIYHGVRWRAIYSHDLQIDYQTRERAPKELTLESDGTCQTLTFPLTPSWVFLLVICMFFLNAGLQIMGFLYFIRISRQLLPTFRLGWIPLFGYFLSATIWGLAGWHMLRSFRRYRHLPRKLWVDPIG